jgi:hypothetical protein
VFQEPLIKYYEIAEAAANDPEYFRFEVLRPRAGRTPLATLDILQEYSVEFSIIPVIGLGIPLRLYSSGIGDFEMGAATGCDILNRVFSVQRVLRRLPARCPVRIRARSTSALNPSIAEHRAACCSLLPGKRRGVFSGPSAACAQLVAVPGPSAGFGDDNVAGSHRSRPRHLRS